MYTYMYVYTHTYVGMYTCICMYVYIYVYIYIIKFYDILYEVCMKRSWIHFEFWILFSIRFHLVENH